MNSRLFLALCVALFGLFATQALATDYCLGIPFSVKETHCAEFIPCQTGMYCDKTATCVDVKPVGTSCEVDEECTFGSFCRGPENAKVCVTISGVGQSCTGDETVAQADCYPALRCNMTTMKCIGGKYGDACTSNTDCSSGTCTAGKCAGPVGTSCSPPVPNNNNDCNPDLYCSDIDFSCTARVAVGASCSGDSCVATAVCLGRSPSDNLNRTCVAKNSVAAGGYCGSQSEACVTGICFNNYCLAKPPTYCTNNGQQCPSDQTCLCGKDYLTTGYGKCASYSCLSKLSDLGACLTSCKSDINSLQYSNSCASLNCKAPYDAAVACNGNLLSLIFSA